MTEFNAGEVDADRGKLIVLRRPRARLRPARDGPAPRRRAYRRALTGPRRRARLRARPTSARCSRRPRRTSSRSATRPTCRPRRRARSPTSRPRCSTENVARFLAGEELEPRIRRPRELLHRDRLPQGPADRLQLRHRAAARATSRPRSGLPLLRESRLNHLGSSCSSGSTGTRCSPAATCRASGPTMPTAGKQRVPSTHRKEDEMTMTLIADAPVDVDAEGFMTDPASGTSRSPRRSRAQNGIPELTDRHWLVVRFMRERVPGDGRRAIHSGARQGVRGSHQGALRALPQGAREARRQDRRNPQAQGLHLGGATMTTCTPDHPELAAPKPRRSRRSRSSSRRARSRASIPA